jgi:glyoxylase-like metal-dependent hydrolase (beta-lactamase superfamily II)
MTTRIAVGSAQVTAVLDAEGPFYLPLPDVFPSVDDDMRLRAAGIDRPPASMPPQTWWLAFWVYVVEIDDRVVLVDTGAASDTDLRPFWAPVGQHLHQRLHEELGLEPDRVTDVVLTHLHRDHAAGAIDPRGHPAFPQAIYHVQGRELDAIDRATAGDLWRPLLDPLADYGQLKVWHADGHLSGSASTTDLRLRCTPGHTPGHQSLVVSHDDELVVLAGDVFTHAAQLIDPYARYVFDDDAVRAGQSRITVLEHFRKSPGRLGTAHLGVPFLELPSDVDRAAGSLGGRS